jgi:hypothetical protein
MPSIENSSSGEMMSAPLRNWPAQFDAVSLAIVLFDGRLPIPQRHHELPIPCGGLPAHDHDIAGQDSFIPHRLAFDPQAEILAS